MYKTPTITQQLDRIGEDILKVLAAHRDPVTNDQLPLTQRQLHHFRDKEKCDLSEYGWSFALERLEKKHLVEFIPPYFWKLKDAKRKLYILTLQETLETTISPD